MIISLLRSTFLFPFLIIHSKLKIRIITTNQDGLLTIMLSLLLSIDESFPHLLVLSLITLINSNFLKMVFIISYLILLIAILPLALVLALLIEITSPFHLHFILLFQLFLFVYILLLIIHFI